MTAEPIQARCELPIPVELTDENAGECARDFKRVIRPAAQSAFARLPCQPNPGEWIR